ncbi:FdrA family protein [Phycicoccus sp. 3266]|uniref:FdrA family protein n=1 Tax=Phycicoccus sp. 3266 TaxID=2817751 RepID=UPI00285A6A6B|nr:FdrA family protein [Phycicoccus sp. 3266]MDR6862404.1 FdrA protein [Phycicoccus sp. 3266]
MTEHVEVRRGAYHDSVSLMQVSRQVATSPGVTAAQVAMATDLNVDVLRGMGFEVPADARPNDLLLAVRGEDDAAVQAALATAAAALDGLRTASQQAGGFGDAPAPRTLGRAVDAGGATLALVSVPGPYAVVEALDAIEHGVSVMVFSDNVPVEDEVQLKDLAAERDVLVMGPDCGTAVVGGVALGFANVVDRGPVGIVAASGTGAQQVMALLDAAGLGVSHCLGVGGRDLSAAVAGRSTRQALAALAADEGTERIVVVSKPPAPEVLADLEAHAAGLAVPVHWATLGPGRPDLTAAVEEVVAAAGGSLGEGWPPQWHPRRDPDGTAARQEGESLLLDGLDEAPERDLGSPTWALAPDPAEGGHDTATAPGTYLRGLFCGGTLADEAMLVAGEALGPIRSNTPLSPELALGTDLRADAHVVIDFGDDRLTRGRAHPMIDPTLRLERIAAEAADPTCGVLLLDLVLGHGAHPDPAPELAAAVTAARATAADAGRELPVVVSLTGTPGDPQDLSACARQLTAAGAHVHLSNAAAARHAVELLAREEER